MVFENYLDFFLFNVLVIVYSFVKMA